MGTDDLGRLIHELDLIDALDCDRCGCELLEDEAITCGPCLGDPAAPAGGERRTDQ